MSCFVVFEESLCHSSGRHVTPKDVTLVLSSHWITSHIAKVPIRIYGRDYTGVPLIKTLITRKWIGGVLYNLTFEVGKYLLSTYPRGYCILPIIRMINCLIQKLCTGSVVLTRNVTS